MTILSPPFGGPHGSRSLYYFSAAICSGRPFGPSFGRPTYYAIYAMMGMEHGHPRRLLGTLPTSSTRRTPCMSSRALARSPPGFFPTCRCPPSRRQSVFGRCGRSHPPVPPATSSAGVSAPAGPAFLHSTSRHVHHHHCRHHPARSRRLSGLSVRSRGWRLQAGSCGAAAPHHHRPGHQRRTRHWDIMTCAGGGCKPAR